MPSTITHSYFAMDVYDRLPIKRREFLMNDKERLKLSAQSLDPLFFYNITNFKKGKKVREFGEFFHNNKCFLFLETLINYIKYNDYGHNPEIIAYLYGMICHYVLDSSAHPYIIYKTGSFDKNNPLTYKYNHLHGEVETLLDNYFIQEREQVKPWKFNCIDYCFQQAGNLSEELSEVINFAFQETFGIKNMSNFYCKATAQMRFFFKVFREDSLGIKKIGYKIVDIVTPKKYLRKTVLSYHQPVRNVSNLLNLKHEKWYNPTNKRLSSKESFIDIYLASMFRAVNIIEEIDKYIYEDKKINLKTLLKNYSYITGVDCSKNKELKYFSF
ncbi:MAG: zinc dependent phospholipase C family protein [Bacilli bacterium]